MYYIYTVPRGNGKGLVKHEAIALISYVKYFLNYYLRSALCTCMHMYT